MYIEQLIWNASNMHNAVYNNTHLIRHVTYNTVSTKQVGILKGETAPFNCYEIVMDVVM